MKVPVRVIALLSLVASSLAPLAAGAETRLSVMVGGGYGYPYYHHHHHRYYSDWGSPVYPVPPPPMVYAPPQTVLVPQMRAVGLDAAQSSPTFVDRFGRSCREYQTTINIGGIMQRAYGTACLQPDGSWRVVE